MSEQADIFEVVCWDWTPPDNVVDTFDTDEDAQRFCRAMDDCALRCYVRRVHANNLSR